MSNAIDDLFLANVVSAGTAKQVAVKESMSWKNIFDKSMLKMLAEAEAGHSVKDISVNRNPHRNTDIESITGQRGVSDATAKSVSADENVATAQPRDQATLDKNEILRNSQVRYAGSELANLITQFRMPTINNKAALMLSNTANSYMSSNMNGSMQHAQARIHFTVDGEIIRIYTRTTKENQELVLKNLKNIVSMLDTKAYVIQEIKLNGKPLSIFGG